MKAGDHKGMPLLLAIALVDTARDVFSYLSRRTRRVMELFPFWHVYCLTPLCFL